MKILEVRDGFIKFEADSNIYLSSFIRIDGIEKSYIAQVIQLKISGENPIGYAKILFLYDGTLIKYDKTLPSNESKITEFTYEILNNSISSEKPVIAGKTLGEIPIVIDASAFDKKMLVSVDDKKSNNILIRNFTKQFNNLSKNVVIIDTLGIIEAKKIKAGVDFKLPLNTDSLAFMYRDCLNDATAESKATIVEIFKELAEYSQTVPFLPFEALKNIVDNMVDKEHVFKLLVLKNKLAKFDRLGYFAKNKQEVDSLKHLLNSKCTIIDLSELDPAFQNKYLEFIYETLEEFNNTQIFLEMSNVVDKKNIKKILSNENIPTTVITHSKFKYLNDIKNVFDNFIITPSLSNNEIFGIYSTFLKFMPKNTFLISGESTNYIPLVSSVGLIDDIIEIQTKEIEENINDNIDDSELESITLPEEHTEESAELISNDDTPPVVEELAPLEDNTTDISQEFIEEPLEEVEAERPSEEEVLASIEAKSDDIIAKSAEELAMPDDMDMFGSDEDSTISATPEILDEKEEQNAIILEETQQNNFEEINNDTLQEMLDEPEEVSEVLEPNIQDNTEEIPLTEAFETEVHTNEEIADYIEPDEITEQEEINLTEELDDNTILTDTDNSTLESIAEEETSILIDDDIDLDLDPEQSELLEEQPSTNLESEEEKNIEILPISSNDNDEFDEIVELNPDEIDENDIVIDMGEMNDDEEVQSIQEEEDLDAQIVKDVDKVFTTRKDDDISDSDLDFIDELNSDEEVLLEEVSEDDTVLEEISDSTEESNGILETPQEPLELKEDNEELEILETRSSSTPIVPVYDADIPQEDLVMSDPIQQGDTVTHAKYGTGVVEKMIKYGNKTLFSINFDNIGRRLLDPTLTEIKKS